MVHTKWFSIFLVLMAALVFSSPLLAQRANQTVEEKVTNTGVTLTAWNDSTQQEKYAYLLGLMTMVEMEKNWQGENPLPFKQSLASSWSIGLSDMTFKQIADTVDNYAAAHPDEGQRQVVEVLWFQLVQPKIAFSK